MSQHDPFSGSRDDGKTVVRPTPGGRRRPVQEPAPAPAVPSRRGYSEAGLQSGVGSTASQLTASALQLLMLVPKLRKLAYHNAIGELQDRLISEIGGFQNRSLQQGYSEEQVRVASYLLCSLIDETVLNTPWGSESFWGHDSLLVKFHKEAHGGERFFQIVERMLQRPAQNLDLLELAYLCLSLGFEGRYRHLPNGAQNLEQLRLDVYAEIQAIRGESERSLSVNWHGLRDLRSPLTRYVPLWVLTVCAGLFLLLLYLGFSYAINLASNRIYGNWMAIATEEAKVVPPPEPVPAPVQPAPVQDRLLRWREILAPEIAKKMVDVFDGPILRVSGSFASGSDQILKTYQPMLLKIALELKNRTAQVEVVGHTDNQRIFTARFPSNWDLSNARAKNVAAFLDEKGSLGPRISYKGRADTAPIVPNDTPEHRALNRRIDIHISGEK